MYTIDTSVWVNAFDRSELGYQISRKFLTQVKQQNIPVFVPTLVLVEVAAAISRTRRRPEKAVAFARSIEVLPMVTLLSLDYVLAESSMKLGAQTYLRGADAVFAAVALEHYCTLITLDHEQLTRLTGVLPTLTPTQALANLPPAS